MYKHTETNLVILNCSGKNSQNYMKQNHKIQKATFVLIATRYLPEDWPRRETSSCNKHKSILLNFVKSSPDGLLEGLLHCDTKS